MTKTNKETVDTTTTNTSDAATDTAEVETVKKSEYDALFNQAQNIINNLNSEVSKRDAEIAELKSDKVYLKKYIDSLTAATDKESK